ncbi:MULTISPECIES: hypothetical protein [unclassified Mesorhizobium]|uniref:hypothetical protein n=1 Tax=unclassified Mesorhizobium TaxID=325217 RepID=UPI003337246B
MATRSELVEAIVERYRSGSRSDKRLILDEFVAVTGYPRKDAIRVFRHRASKTPPQQEAQPWLWWRCSRRAGGVVGGIRVVVLPSLNGMVGLELDAALRGKLLTMSPATIDRLLAEARVVSRGGQRRRAMCSAVRRSVPVRLRELE